MYIQPGMYLNLVFLLTLVSTILAENSSDVFEDQVVNRVIKQCSLSGSKYSCLANKAAVAVERATHFDIPLFDGFVLVRNAEYVDNETTPRFWNNGIGRLSFAVSKFLDSHTVKLDLTEVEQPRADGGFAGFGGKKGRKQRKYLHYAVMALLGVFGISGPLIMKTLSIVAGKALIASKIALLIVGSVALKKIFEKDQSHPSVKVHTHTITDHSEEYDRHINAGAYKFLNTI